MTDLRDKIHQVVRGNLPATSRADMHANDVTDAIMAALPDMVAPLVWERHPVGWIAVSASHAYHIDTRGKRPRITKGIWGTPEHEDLEAAKGRCEIDNIARIRGALSVQNFGSNRRKKR